MTQFKDKSAKHGTDGHDRRPVHLPGAHGGRHPAVRHDARPRGGGPAPAPRAHAGPRAAAELPVRSGHRRRAGAAHRQGHRQDLRPAGPDGQDEQVGREPERPDRAAGRPEGRRQAHPVGGDGRRARDPVRPRGQAGRLQPAHHLLGADRPGDPRARGRLRGQGLRRPQGGPGGRRRRLPRAVPGPRARLPRPTRRRSTTSWPTAPTGRSELAPGTLERLYDRSGLLPRARARGSAREAAGAIRRPGPDRCRHHRARAVRLGAAGGARPVRRPVGASSSRRTSPCWARR